MAFFSNNYEEFTPRKHEGQLANALVQSLSNAPSHGQENKNTSLRFCELPEYH